MFSWQFSENYIAFFICQSLYDDVFTNLTVNFWILSVTELQPVSEYLYPVSEYMKNIVYRSSFVLYYFVM